MKKIKEIGHIRHIGHISLIGLIGPISLISLIGLIGLTTSCRNSREEVEPTQEPEPAGVAITFSGLESDEQEQTAGVKGTRAGLPLSNLGILKFRVWGYKNMSYTGTGSYESPQLVFPGYTVNYKDGSAASTTTNTNGWEYVAQQESGDDQQTIKYWDFNANAYRYYAVTGTAAADAEDLKANPSKYLGDDPKLPTTFTFAADASPEMKTVGTDEVVDKAATALKYARTPFFTKLWFSDGNPENYPEQEFGKPVQLEFMKPFARVRFIFIYAYPREGILLENKCFKPTTDYDPDPKKHKGIVRKGTVTISYPLSGTYNRVGFESMTPDATDAKLLEAFTVDADPEDDSKVYPDDVPEGWYLVLPCTSQGSYTLQVTINTKIKTETKSCVVPAEYMRWLPGYSYTYIFKINEEGGIEIELVEAAVTPWTELETARTVYNW